MVFKLKVDIKFYWLLLKLLSLPKLLKHSLLSGRYAYKYIYEYKVRKPREYGYMAVWGPYHGLLSKKWSGLGDWETGYP